MEVVIKEISIQNDMGVNNKWSYQIGLYIVCEVYANSIIFGFLRAPRTPACLQVTVKLRVNIASELLCIYMYNLKKCDSLQTINKYLFAKDS